MKPENMNKQDLLDYLLQNMDHDVIYDLGVDSLSEFPKWQLLSMLKNKEVFKK